MLRTLSIENVAVIKNTEINFGDKLCILTGETGAGKSILIDSLAMVLGARSSKELIRSGCENAYVSALFDNCSDELINTLKELGFSAENNEILITRNLQVDGHSSCRINGKPCTTQIIKDISPLLVNIHGQHDNQQLLNPAHHFVYLDRMGNNEELLNKYKSKFCELRDIVKQIRELETDSEARERKLDLLSFQINELENASITIGETDKLNERKNIINNSEKTAKLLQSAINEINGAEKTGAIESSFNASHEISKAAKIIPELEDTYLKLEDLAYKLRDISDTLEEKLRDIDYNQNDIDEIEERLDLLYRLSKKYGHNEEEMLSFLANAKIEYDKLINADSNFSNLQKLKEIKLKETLELADMLSESRHKTAQAFKEQVQIETAFLNMPNVQFDVEFTPSDLGINGREKIEFLISVNLGEPLKPLSKVASGGELSRIMLAIKNVLSEYDDVDTMVFDEIDTGISGRAADKVGLKLKEVANKRQVICITHLAQIAAKATQHLLIEKKDINDTTETTVRELDYEGKKLEIARIIGGNIITDTTLSSAEELMNN